MNRFISMNFYISMNRYIRWRPDAMTLAYTGGESNIWIQQTDGGRPNPAASRS
jgi:hypothetical protein